MVLIHNKQVIFIRKTIWILYKCIFFKTVVTWAVNLFSWTSLYIEYQKNRHLDSTNSIIIILWRFTGFIIWLYFITNVVSIACMSEQEQLLKKNKTKTCKITLAQTKMLYHTTRHINYVDDSYLRGNYDEDKPHEI